MFKSFFNSRSRKIYLLIFFVIAISITTVFSSNDKMALIAGSQTSYDLKKISSTNKRWFQFEDVGITAAYPSNSFFLPYYKTPVAGGNSTYSPAAVFYNNKYILAYEKVSENSSQIYAKTSSTDQIDSFLDSEQLLVSNTGFDSIKNPSFVNVGNKTYLAVEVVQNNSSKIAVIEYTGQMEIIVKQDDIINLNVNFDGYSGQMEHPSLTYDGTENILRLYFVSKIQDSPVMFYAQSSTTDPKDFEYKESIKELIDGTVFHSAGGYFAIFKTYFDNQTCITEWASSPDGIKFNRESVLVNGNSILNGKMFSTGSATAAIDNNGIIKAVFAETWLDDINKSGIMMSLPQMRVCVSNKYVTLSNNMALTSQVQVLKSERDYTTTDVVRLYSSPTNTIDYEVIQNINAGNAFQVIPMNSNTAVRTSCYKIANESISDLSLIQPEGINGNSETPLLSPSNLINYDKSLIWQTKAVYTFNPKPEELTITLPAELDVGAVAIAGYDGAGFPEAFEVLYSTDNITYKPVKSVFDFPSIANKDDIVFKFDNMVKAKYIKFVFERYTLNGSCMLQVVLSKVKVYGVNVPSQYINDSKVN